MIIKVRVCPPLSAWSIADEEDIDREGSKLPDSQQLEFSWHLGRDWRQARMDRKSPSNYYQINLDISPPDPTMILAHLKDEIIWMELMGRSRKSKRRLRRRLVFHLFNNVWFSLVKPCKSSLSPVSNFTESELLAFSLLPIHESGSHTNGELGPSRWLTNRGDDKKIEEFKLVGGSVIHLVLALRGGSLWTGNPRGQKASGK